MSETVTDPFDELSTLGNSSKMLESYTYAAVASTVDYSGGAKVAAAMVFSAKVLEELARTVSEATVLEAIEAVDTR